MTSGYHATAHGRVNLIGEHTDYNGGLVLPAPIPQRTRVHLTTRGDQMVRVHSRVMREERDYDLGHERRSGTWLDYIMGCTQVLRGEGFAIRGMDIAVESQVPPGVGLSSSAALLIAALRAMRQAFNLPLTDVQLALLGQRAEQELVGAPVGVMDLMSASLGECGQALLIDTSTLTTRAVQLPRCDFVVINSGIEHAHANGSYRERRAECEEAARLLGVSLLSMLTRADLDRVARLPSPLDKRVRHVITENERVAGAVEAIDTVRWVDLGKLFVASHESLRDDFEVSLPDIDFLVDLALANEHVLGARLTGGGFGGCVLVLARPGTGNEVAEVVVAQYLARTARAATVLIGGGELCVPS